jgi:hypothetical protein
MQYLYQGINSQVRLVRLVSRQWAGQQREYGLTPGMDKRYCLVKWLQTGFGAHIAVVRWTLRLLPPGTKRPERENGYSFPTSVEFKNEAIPPLLHMPLWSGHGQHSILHKGSLHSQNTETKDGFLSKTRKNSIQYADYTHVYFSSRGKSAV